MYFQSSDVVDYLNGIDIVRLQGVDTSTKGCICTSAVWHTIIQRELPQFEVSDDLWCDLKLTHLIVRCFGFLSRAVLSRTCVVKITSKSDLERLETCLSKAAATRTSHVAAGGRIACVLVGDFLFTERGKGTKFRFNGNGQDVLGGLPAGQLEVKVCVSDDGSISLGAKYYARGSRRCLAVREGAFEFTTNLLSVDSETKISFRQGRLSLDGTLRKALHGLCPMVPSSRTGASLCVVSLTDGPPDGPSQLAAALNMDAPARHGQRFSRLDRMPI
eukprot:TRINITY_DN3270_c0_g2_i1.p1 TRINITY_DN3270_c0_g2~~TRINITY_DN3270_c0_g2_i1.p1  ORF type:complete len:274 (-),score=27.57 TRINITY_DN3270_c0_g2_i1:360-1181(-)